YFASSASSWLLVGGSVHTPLGWSAVSAGLALTSLLASSTKPASVASCTTSASVRYPDFFIVSSAVPGVARWSTTPRVPPGASTSKNALKYSPALSSATQLCTLRK